MFRFSSFSSYWSRKLYLVVLGGTFFTLASKAPAQAISTPMPAGFCAPVHPMGNGPLMPAFAPGLVPQALADLLARAYRIHSRLDQIPASTALLKKARAQAESEGNTCAQALAVFGLASNADNARFNDAADFYRLSITLFTSLHSPLGEARSHFGLGSTFAYKTDKKSAAAELALAAAKFKETGDAEEELYTRINEADMAGQTDYAAFVTEAQAGHFPCVEAKAHSLWSARHFAANNFAQSMEQAGLADSLFAHCPGRSYERSAVQTAMGRLERSQGRPKVALEHYRFALQLQLQSGDLSLVPQTYNAMAVAYDSVEDFVHSIPLYKKGLEEAKRIHSQPYIDFLEANLANTYARSGHANLAVPLLEQLTKQNMPSDTVRCTRFWQLGRAYVAVHRPKDALTALNVALPACRAQGDKSRIINAVEIVSRAEIALHEYDQALKNAHEALDLVEEQRAHLVPEDAYKQGFVDQEKSIYDDTISALTAQNKPEEALECAEQARARAFLDLLESRKLNAAVPAAADAHKDLIASPAHTTALTTAQMSSATARLHSTLVSYWVAPDTTYIWIIRPDEPVFEATSSISTERLQKLIASTHQPSALNAGINPAWATLYQALISPVELHLPLQQNDLLTIVPAGPLFALSFSALRGPSVGTHMPQVGRYLLERFRLHTIPTVGILQYTQRNAEAVAAKREHLLLVANPARPPAGVDGHPLPELPGAEAELGAIAHTLPAADVVRLEGRDATLPQVTAALPDATMVHFATHAVLNETTPYDSFLALDDEHQGGKLTIADIYGLHLNTRLVVLSACRSGLGAISGDGVDGMSRAFFYAGSATVLTTLWDVADRPTSRMMPRFYQALQHGSSPSEALRSAQLATLADLRAGRISAETFSGTRKLPPDPLFWAGFTLAGEP